MMPILHRSLLAAAGIAVLSGLALAEGAPKKAAPSKTIPRKVARPATAPKKVAPPQAAPEKAAPPATIPKKVAPPEITGGLLNLLGAGDMADTASDLRKAGEAFERFGNVLETITPTMTEGLTEGSRNVASMGYAFDPLGLKTAFTVLQEQSQTIYALQAAEIQRLKEECQRLRKALAERRSGKTKRSKKGPK